MKRFIKDESGVITIEWVVLGASLFLIALGMTVIIAGGFRNGAQTVETGVSHTDMPDDMRTLLEAARSS